jgi:hypothetical protein
LNEQVLLKTNFTTLVNDGSHQLNIEVKFGNAQKNFEVCISNMSNGKIKRLGEKLLGYAVVCWHKWHHKKVQCGFKNVEPEFLKMLNNIFETSEEIILTI